MTLTDELFLPSRIIYRVFDRKRLIAKLRSLRSIVFDPDSQRWVWNYEYEDEQAGFQEAYDRIPPERRPLVLASCFLLADDWFHVYIRSAIRVTKALVFFDRHVPRSCARAEFLDEYNLLTRTDPKAPLPVPEDFFRDESKIVFIDVEKVMEENYGNPARLRRMMGSVAVQLLQPLERHRLSAFYEDGEEHMKTAMRMREIMAMKQGLSDVPIRPPDVYRELFSGNASAAPAEVDAQLAPDVPIPMKFSFMQVDLQRDAVVLDLGPVLGGAYIVRFEACSNPFCQCRVVDLRLTPVGEPQGGAAPPVTQSFLLDDRKVEASGEFMAMAGELSARMIADDWLLAERIYRQLKADVSEPEDTGHLEVSFPEDVLDEPAGMLSYQDVFPYSNDLQFPCAGRLWNAHEFFCSNPDCSCAEVTLEFAGLAADAASLVSPVHAASFIAVGYDHKTRKIDTRHPCPPGTPPARELVARLRETFPRLDERLKRRQRVLRDLHGKARRSHQPHRSTPVVRGNKTGRNEPCPCGSGKKYKVCCGR
jgi:hypothetical protein